MEGYKQSFIEFMVSAEVLTFGDFVAKSGRKTPYFVNAGKYRTGQQMRQLAGYYADAIISQQLHFDVLFGPAYKGIPLAVAIAKKPKITVKAASLSGTFLGTERRS